MKLSITNCIFTIRRITNNNIKFHITNLHIQISVVFNKPSIIISTIFFIIYKFQKFIILFFIISDINDRIVFSIFNCHIVHTNNKNFLIYNYFISIVKLIHNILHSRIIKFERISNFRNKFLVKIGIIVKFNSFICHSFTFIV